MTDYACPSCGTDLNLEVEALLPEQTEITLTLHITPGQLCMAETVGATIVNFAHLQEEVAKALDCEVSVFMAGLKYEDDIIYLTFRMANTVKGKVAKSASADTHPKDGDVKQGAVHEGADPQGIAQPSPESNS